MAHTTKSFIHDSWISLVPAGALIFALLPTQAAAVPVTFQGTSGHVWGLQMTVDGQVVPLDPTLIPDRSTIDPYATGTSLNGSIPLDVLNSQITVDLDVGTYGELLNFDLRMTDFSIQMDASLVALQAVDVYDATISSAFTGGIDMDPSNTAFGCPASRICAESVVTAEIQGIYPDATVFPDASSTTTVISLDNEAELLFILSNNVLQLAIFGVTIAQFPQIAHPDYVYDLNDPSGGLPLVTLQANILFIGDVATAIPEPTSATMFSSGTLVAGYQLRRRRQQHAT